MAPSCFLVIAGTIYGLPGLLLTRTGCRLDQRADATPKIGGHGHRKPPRSAAIYVRGRPRLSRGHFGANMDSLLRLPRVKEHVGLSRTQIYKQIKLGKFPRPVSLGGSRSVAWRSSEISQWIADRTPKGSAVNV